MPCENSIRPRERAEFADAKPMPEGSEDPRLQSRGYHNTSLVLRSRSILGVLLRRQPEPLLQLGVRDNVPRIDRA
jgi:hypothetical protein